MDVVHRKWEVAWDLKHKRWYYSDRATGAASWKQPEGCTLELPTGPPEVPFSDAPTDLPPGWTAAWDARHKRYYFFNRETEERTWRKPQLQESSSAASPAAKVSKAAADLPPGWEAEWDATYNRVYFFNRATLERTWVKPGDLPPGWEASWDAKNNRTYFFNRVTLERTWVKPQLSEVPDKPKRRETPGDLPPGWEAAWDTTHNRNYFFNRATLERTWIKPQLAATASVSASGATVPETLKPTRTSRPGTPSRSSSVGSLVRPSSSSSHARSGSSSSVLATAATTALGGASVREMMNKTRAARGGFPAKIEPGEQASRATTPGSMPRPRSSSSILQDYPIDLSCFERPSSSSAERKDHAPSAQELRRRRRWGDGVDAPQAGARSFFPSGWKPDSDMTLDKFMLLLGSTPDERAQIRLDAQSKLTLTNLHGIDVDEEELAHIMAYTAETCIVKNLTHTMRTPGTGKALSKMTTYLWNLSNALKKLPVYRGLVFRGLDKVLSEATYPVGEVVCWQAFSSSTKKILETVSFLKTDGLALSGTLLIIESRNGYEVELVSQSPFEEEVLFCFNTFFHVQSWLTTEEKCSSLPDLFSYDLSSLAVVKLREA